MVSNYKLPSGYERLDMLDLSSIRNKVIMMITSIVCILVFGWLFLQTIEALRPEVMTNIIPARLSSQVIIVFLVILLLLLVVLLHEALHGVFFWLLTRERPKFKLRITFAYAAAQGSYLRRNRYVAITLVPFLVVTLSGLIAVFFAPAQGVLLVAFLTATHAGACAGDLVTAVWALRHPPSVLINDEGRVMQAYGLVISN